MRSELQPEVFSPHITKLWLALLEVGGDGFHLVE
jgi:hypothetical protein